MASRFRGCIYSTTPSDPHFQLSPESLRLLEPQLVGLPVRVEHCERGIGKITGSWIDDAGRAFVEWEMDDDVRGWGASKLINVGSVSQLSLKHAVYEDGSLRAIEVSLCEKGARPDTDITARLDSASGTFEPFAAASKYITEAPPALYVSASTKAMDPQELAKATALVLSALGGQQQPPAAAPAAVPVEAPVAPPPPAPEAVPVLEAAPPAETLKRSRDVSTDDNESRRKKTQSDAERLMKAAEQAASKMDPADAQQLIASMTDVLSNQVNSEKLIGITQTQLSEMLAKVNDQKDTHKDLAKDIVEGIVTLWSELTPERTVTASDRAFMQGVYESNPRFAILSQPMVIAASSLANRGIARKATELEVELAKARSLVGMMGSQLNAFSAMSNAEPAPPAAPQWVVAASGQQQQQQVQQQQMQPEPEMTMRLPSTLSGMPKYEGHARTLVDLKAGKL